MTLLFKFILQTLYILLNLIFNHFYKLSKLINYSRTVCIAILNKYSFAYYKIN